MKHDRMQWLIKILRRAGLLVYRQGFWMAHFAHPNFKLTKIWSTSSRVWKLDFGKLTPDMRSKHSSNTTKRYTNAKGEHRFTGTKELKSSQSLARTSIFSSFVLAPFVPTCCSQHLVLIVTYKWIHDFTSRDSGKHSPPVNSMGPHGKFRTS